MDSLIAVWSARTRALRAHLAGEVVSVLNVDTELLQREGPGTVGWATNLSHEGQLLSSLGIEVMAPEEGPLVHWGGAVAMSAETMSRLTAPTVFITIDDQRSPVALREVLGLEPLASLPAVRGRRAFDLRWFHTRTGWFTANEQLDVIARAFGVRRLRTLGPAPSVHLAVASTGRVTAATTADGGTVTLHGPRIDVALELADGHVADIDVGEEAAADIRTFPEAYTITSPGRSAVALEADRESALERVTRRYAA